MRSRTVARISVLLALLAAGFWPTLPGAAADELIQAEPPQDGIALETPHHVLLTFDRDLAQLINAHSVEVRDTEGHRLDNDGAAISTYSARTLVVPLSRHGEGEIKVTYSVRFKQADGGLSLEQGSYRFTINPLAPGEAGVAELGSAAKSGMGLVLWTLAILIGASFGGLLLYFLRLATGNARNSLEPQNRTPFKD